VHTNRKTVNNATPTFAGSPKEHQRHLLNDAATRSPIETRCKLCWTTMPHLYALK